MNESVKKNEIFDINFRKVRKMQKICKKIIETDWFQEKKPKKNMKDRKRGGAYQGRGAYQGQYGTQVLHSFVLKRRP